MDLYSILHLLADGEFHSGSELGRVLGVSRTTVWKDLSQLGDYNLRLESVKGKGYRLSQSLDLLDSELMQSFLDERIRAKLSLEILLATDSTNTFLLTKLATGKLYDVCLAEYQYAGKGRRGRTWVSPFARNLYVSVAFDLTGGADSLSGLSLVIGLSVVRSLKKMGVKGLGLKWPNDIWLDGKKLAGILVELHGEATTSWRVVAGIGLNVSMDQSEAQEIDQPWASLNNSLSVGRNELAAHILSCLIDDLEEFKRRGFSAFMSEWRSHDVLDGKEVLINGGALKGQARGVDLAGALLLETEAGMQVINAGEVSVRRT